MNEKCALFRLKTHQIRPSSSQSSLLYSYDTVSTSHHSSPLSNLRDSASLPLSPVAHGSLKLPKTNTVAGLLSKTTLLFLTLKPKKVSIFLLICFFFIIEIEVDFYLFGVLEWRNVVITGVGSSLALLLATLAYLSISRKGFSLSLYSFCIHRVMI